MSASGSILPGDSSLRECWVKSGQTDLFCRVVGNGPPLIIVHGGPGLTMDYLFPHLKPLANCYTLIFYDQRGNEKARDLNDEIQINENEMNLTVFIQDLLAVRNHFGHQQVALLGHSWGAYLALAFATTYPELVNQLIIANTIPLSSEELDTKKEDPYEKMIADLVHSEAFKNNDAAGLIEIMNATFKYFFYRPTKVDQLGLETLTVSQLKKMALIHKLFESNFFHQPHNLYPELVKLDDIPTLILHGGSNDIPLVIADKVASSLKKSTFNILYCAGHFPFIELPDQFFKAIDRFNAEIVFKEKFANVQSIIAAYKSDYYGFIYIKELINYAIEEPRGSSSGARLLKKLIKGLESAFPIDVRARQYQSAHDLFASSAFSINLLKIYELFLPKDVISIIAMLQESRSMTGILGGTNKAIDLIFTIATLIQVTLRSKVVKFDEAIASYLYEDPILRAIINDAIKTGSFGESYYKIACDSIKDWLRSKDLVIESDAALSLGQS